MRILLIDDDRDFVEATRVVLESMPCALEVAYNGRTGLELARARRPDLIILDILMPGESGLDVYEKLRADPKLADIPVILLTSFAGGLIATPTSERTAFIEKPVRPAELLKRVGELAVRD